MKNKTLREQIEHLWHAGYGGQFSDEKILNQLLQDGGLDTEDLTLEAVTGFLDEKEPEGWAIARFAFAEVLAHYLVVEDEMSLEQAVSAAFSACVLADAGRSGEGDWEMEHNKVISLCAILRERFEFEDFLPLMTYIFGKGGKSPISGYPEKPT